MTGHIGARRNREVALVTDDFRLYHELAPFLERMGVPVVGLRPGEEVPVTVQVLLDGPPDDPRSVPVQDDREATLLACLQALDDRRAVREAGTYRLVVFGIDPGRVLGLAVLADEEVLLAAEALSPQDAVARVASWCRGLRSQQWEVHVGDGDPPVGTQVVAEARTRLPDVQVLVVSEEATTPFSPATGSRHADAAIHIARRRA